ncbi:TIGR03087 family PEP-CTERM/XrtA system glycosyltransferase [Novosphingobium taihuense]|uniref:Sugar transferase (PEP-CTERM/EpsH1 system associated) n=1 Tax=Novosphingobium taihuense TaxID=260085 RepID=A0A7W7A939_9SPHN|nr:TIGR03087 family PEP-CTERM/XrtA system glycosyltransferase [Novosphingobium taihuense]MBB4612546.1 sugar transferase (PEP-CTERM/EpsH1 system associated) [Novosphingobium taihuense]TWH88102.1 sugar transferase (PEP-CTERM/EpsH1 system associated) [Novosphingobium taihuense]
MSEVLFLAHRIPFPPDRGDKIRSCHVLRHIAGLAPVHVACFADDEGDMAHEPELIAVAASHCLVPRTRSLKLAGVEALASARPVSLTAFADKRIATYVAQILAERPISAIYVFSGQMAQYIPATFAGRVVMDFVDVDSAKFEAYAAAARFPASRLYAREARLLSRFESDIARRAHASLLVTPEEAALFRQRLTPGSEPRVMALGNGIDTDFFDPEGMPPAPEMAGEGPQLTFTGQMDYPPNVAAVEMFAREVMPQIRATFPQARFNVVGRAPTLAVRSLERVNGTRVTGAVIDVRPWLAGADLVVAPLTIARGVQNKVLEAMAMARPVLATPEAATGIPAREGHELVVASGSDALAKAALSLLHDKVRAATIGQSARAFVLEKCGWAGVLAPLAGLLGLSGPESPRVAA